MPTKSGIAADQAVVPEAVPAEPKLVAQDTCVTPTLSLAVPAMVTKDAVVDMVPVEGVVMVKLGAVVSVPPPPEPAAARVTVSVLNTWLPPAEAVIVMIFGPTDSGILAMVQADGDCAAIPEAPVEADQATVIAPDPPVAEPDKLTLATVVVDTTWFTVNARAAGGGGMTVDGCAA